MTLEIDTTHLRIIYATGNSSLNRDRLTLNRDRLTAFPLKGDKGATHLAFSV